MVRLAHSDLADAMTRLGPDGDGVRNPIVLQRALDDLHDASLYLQSADAIAVLYASDGVTDRDHKPENEAP
jgi:hypothetical protein